MGEGSTSGRRNRVGEGTELQTQDLWVSHLEEWNNECNRETSLEKLEGA